MKTITVAGAIGALLLGGAAVAQTVGADAPAADPAPGAQGAMGSNAAADTSVNSDMDAAPTAGATSADTYAADTAATDDYAASGERG
jgi:hypothetical protein